MARAEKSSEAKAMVDDHGGMKREFTSDGVHPNAAGYALMGKLAEKAIAASLATT